MGIYSDKLFRQVDGIQDPDREIHNTILDKLLSHFYSIKTPARTVSFDFVEKISKKSGLSVS